MMKVDKDGTGMIDFPEFLSMMSLKVALIQSWICNILQNYSEGKLQKNLSARLALEDKKYFLSIQSEVLDGQIFLSGKVDEPEEKIKITKMAWETKGVRSVKNAITIKGQTNFKN